MIGSLIGGAIGAIGSLFGGSKASEAMEKVKGNLEAQRSANESWYNRRYNEDATQRADAQRILAKTEEAIRNRNRAAAGKAAMMGGTEESVASTKAANAQAMADAASQIAVAGERRKDRIEEMYRERDSKLQDSLNNMEIGKANAIASATKGLGESMSSLGSSVDEWLDARSELKKFNAEKEKEEEKSNEI